jgi:hypothetical protein
LHQFSATVKKQLLLDVGLVGFDGLYAEVQFLCNLASAAAFTDQAEHFEFTIGKEGRVCSRSIASVFNRTPVTKFIGENDLL